MTIKANRVQSIRVVHGSLDPPPTLEQYKREQKKATKSWTEGYMREARKVVIDETP